jgi:hypothetical protein
MRNRLWIRVRFMGYGLGLCVRDRVRRLRIRMISTPAPDRKMCCTPSTRRHRQTSSNIHDRKESWTLIDVVTHEK